MDSEDTKMGSQRLMKDLVVKNAHGLHARSGALLAKTSNQFESEVTLEKNGQVVNGKSIMGVLMLAAGQNSVLKVVVEGDDAEAALSAISALFEAGFHEAP
jgi:phosphocarrier protein HPr